MCIFLLAGTPFARAETVAECVTRLKDPVQCYVTQAKFQLKLCSMKIELALLKNESDFSCISEARRDVEPFYSAASKAFAQKKAAQVLLKDAQAYWLSSVSALLPSGDETKLGYKQRLQQREQGFDEKANRVLLEK